METKRHERPPAADGVLQAALVVGKEGEVQLSGFRLARRSRGSSSSSGFSHGNRLDGFHGLSVVGFTLLAEAAFGLFEQIHKLHGGWLVLL